MQLLTETIPFFRTLESFLFGSSASSRLAASVSSSEESEDEEEPRKAKKRPAANSDSDDSDGENDQAAGKRGRRTAAWYDEDDDKTQVQDVVASYAKAKGKHGAKEVSAENYADSIRKKFLTMVDTPKWADLGRSKGSGDDSDDEFFRVRKIFPDW